MSEITTVIGRRHLYYNYRIRYLGQGKVVSAGRLAFVSVMTCCHETLRGSWEFCNSDSTTQGTTNNPHPSQRYGYFLAVLSMPQGRPFFMSCCPSIALYCLFRHMLQPQVQPPAANRQPLTGGLPRPEAKAEQMLQLARCESTPWKQFVPQSVMV